MRFTDALAATADQERAVFRPGSSIWIAVAVWALCALDVVTQLVLHEWSSALRAVPVVGFVATGAWMLFVTPAVIVEPAAVVISNPAREVRIPWSAITDVQPSYSLQAVTVRGRFRAWAAPGGTQLSGLTRFEANERLVSSMALPDDDTLPMTALTDPSQAGQSPAAAASIAIHRGWQLAQRPGSRRRAPRRPS